jgi:hypothetical protein
VVAASVAVVVPIVVVPGDVAVVAIVVVSDVLLVVAAVVVLVDVVATVGTVVGGGTVVTAGSVVVGGAPLVVTGVVSARAVPTAASESSAATSKVDAIRLSIRRARRPRAAQPNTRLLSSRCRGFVLVDPDHTARGERGAGLTGAMLPDGAYRCRFMS